MNLRINLRAAAGLAAAVLTFGFATGLSAQEMNLRLTDVTTPSSMADVRGPVLLFLEFEDGAAVTARAMAPYDVAYGGYNGNGRHTSADASALNLSGSNLSGTVTANVPVAGSNSPKALSVTLSANVGSGQVTGTHFGSYGGTSVAGDITGTVVTETSLPANAEVGLSLDRGMLDGDPGSREQSFYPLFLGLEFEDGALTAASADSGKTAGTIYNPKGGDILEMVGPRGYRQYGAVKEDNVGGASSASGSLGLDDFSATVEVIAPDTSGTFTYTLNGSVIGNAVVGTYSVDEGGSPTGLSGSFLGYAGSGEPVPERAAVDLDVLDAGPNNEQFGFTPPYFGQLTSEQIRDRVYAGALWLTEAPEVGALGNPAALQVWSTTSKQYDNGAFNAYGGATAFGILHELAGDAELATWAGNASRRAGYWLDAIGEDNYHGLAPYYKQMFHVSAWGAMAHMDLYETTGEERWLEAVKGYMTFLENEVTNRMAYDEVHDFPPDDGVPPGRTWTYLSWGSGSVGRSNSRYDRSRDHQELNPGPFLWLLGKLRVEHGVTEFEDFEAGAREWVADNIDDDQIWSGGSGIAPAEGVTFYALYLLDYAPSSDPVRLEKAISYVEDGYMDWSHPGTEDGLTDRFAPHVKNKYSRWASGYLPKFVGGTAETSRMALVYLKRYEDSGDPADLAKAQALAHSVLRRQKPENGMIHHLGIPEFSPDHEVRIFEGPNGTEPDAMGNPNGRLDQHSYSALKGNTLRNLLEYAAELEALGLDCDQAQEITAPTIIEKATSDPAFDLGATATSGLLVSYELVYGPASLDGSTVTLDGTDGIVKVIASQAGYDTWCAATPVAIYISVGDNTPAAPTGIAASSGSTSTIDVNWTDNAQKERTFRIERRAAGETEWQQRAVVGANTTSYLDEELEPGTTYEYRVIAANMVAESAPSAAASASTLSDEQYIFIDIECGDVGYGYEVRDNPSAGGAGDVVTTIKQGGRDEIDPRTVVDYEFYVPQTGTYSLWLRGRAIHGGSSDSVWLMVDDGVYVTLDRFFTQPVCNSGYCWRPNKDTFPLEEGMHKITIAVREKDAVLDRLVLTTSTDDLTDFGVGGPAINCPPQLAGVEIEMNGEDDEVVLAFEAEDGVSYQLETSDSLADGSWSESGPPIEGAGELVVVRRLMLDERAFFRVVILP